MSAIVSNALTGPVSIGENTTPIEQLAPAATLLPQVFVCAKFGPTMLMPEMLSEPLPVLESVTVCAALVAHIFSWPNVRLDAERLIVVAGATPVPDKLTVCGLPLALSVIIREALRGPAAVGVNVTLMSHV